MARAGSGEGRRRSSRRPAGTRRRRERGPGGCPRPVHPGARRAASRSDAIAGPGKRPARSPKAGAGLLSTPGPERDRRSWGAGQGVRPGLWVHLGEEWRPCPCPDLLGGGQTSHWLPLTYFVGTCTLVCKCTD